MVVSWEITTWNLYSRMEIRYRVPVSIMNHFDELNSGSVLHFVSDNQLIFMTKLRFNTVISNSSTPSIICIDPRRL